MDLGFKEMHVEDAASIVSPLQPPAGRARAIHGGLARQRGGSPKTYLRAVLGIVFTLLSFFINKIPIDTLSL